MLLDVVITNSNKSRLHTRSNFHNPFCRSFHCDTHYTCLMFQRGMGRGWLMLNFGNEIELNNQNFKNVQFSSAPKSGNGERINLHIYGPQPPSPSIYLPRPNMVPLIEHLHGVTCHNLPQQQCNASYHQFTKALLPSLPLFVNTTSNRSRNIYLCRYLLTRA